MKQFIIVATIAAVAAAEDQSRCLYCRRASIYAGFLESYSYCNQTDECLADAWNYLDRPCGNSTWTKGSNIHIGNWQDDGIGWKEGKLIEGSNECNAKNIGCPEFVSSEEWSGKYKNQTWALPPKSMCAVKINAEEYLARVIFDNASYLGIEYSGAKIGNPITFESGNHTIWIYNGAESGSLTFELSFSGASQLAAGIVALAAATLTVF